MAFVEDLTPHLYHLFIEPLFDEPTYFEKRMFGCRAVYVHGRLSLVLAAQGDEPWNGILIPTERVLQPDLVQDFPALTAHPVLGKWLYVSQSLVEFEPTVSKIVKAIRQQDPRIGIIPKEKQGKGKKRSTKNTSAKSKKKGSR